MNSRKDSLKLRGQLIKTSLSSKFEKLADDDDSAKFLFGDNIYASLESLLSMVAILTKKKIENKFFANKTVYLAYTCKKSFSKYIQKKLLKYTLKWCLKYGNYDDNVIKQKVKKGIKRVKNVLRSCYLRL